MTNTLLGNDYLAWVETAVAGTYAAILGQGTLSETRSQTNIDTSDKTSNGYMTEAYGNIKVSYSLDIIAKLPDAAYTRLETMINARTPFNFQVRKNGQAGVSADAIFTALMYGTIASRSFTKDGTVDVKISLSLATAPAADTLA
jgi:predicted secreted protein